MENETFRLTLALITVVLTAVIAIYLFYSANKTHKKYISNFKELVKVKENLIETKTELIRKVEMIREFGATNRFLNDKYSETASALFEEQVKKVNVMGAIAAIGRRISIKDLEAFKQKCADIYSDTETA